MASNPCRHGQDHKRGIELRNTGNKAKIGDDPTAEDNQVQVDKTHAPGEPGNGGGEPLFESCGRLLLGAASLQRLNVTRENGGEPGRFRRRPRGCAFSGSVMYTHSKPSRPDSQPLRTVALEALLAGSRKRLRAGLNWSSPATGNQPPDHQNDHCAHHCSDEAGSLTSAIPADGLTEISGDEGTDDPENRGENKTGRLIVAGRDELCDHAGDEPNDDCPNDAHGIASAQGCRPNGS